MLKNLLGGRAEGAGHFRQELTGWFAAGPGRFRRILAYGPGLRCSIPRYSRIPDRELDFSAGDRRQAVARPGPERVVDCFVVLRAYGSPSCATLRGKRHARLDTSWARRVCRFYLGVGRARIPARDQRSQSVWRRSVAARSCDRGLKRRQRAAATSLSDFLLESDSAFLLRLGHTWLPYHRRLRACSTRACRRRGT